MMKRYWVPLEYLLNLNTDYEFEGKIKFISCLTSIAY